MCDRNPKSFLCESQFEPCFHSKQQRQFVLSFQSKNLRFRAQQKRPVPWSQLTWLQWTVLWDHEEECPEDTPLTACPQINRKLSQEPGPNLQTSPAAHSRPVLVSWYMQRLEEASSVLTSHRRGVVSPRDAVQTLLHGPRENAVTRLGEKAVLLAPEGYHQSPANWLLS